MRFLILLVAFLPASCSNEPVEAIGVTSGTFVGTGRNALCIAGAGNAQRGGVIVYGEGDNNCSASGRIEAAGGGLVLIPNGETACRIPLNLAGATVTIGAVPAACRYYCGPETTLDGQVFKRSTGNVPATDLAGDRFC